MQTVTARLASSYRYRLEDQGEAQTYAAGLTQIPAQMAANLLDSGLLKPADIEDPGELDAAQALQRRPTQTANTAAMKENKPPGEAAAATPAPAATPAATPAQATATPPSGPIPRLLPDATTKRAELNAAGLFTIDDVLAAADRLTEISGIGPASAQKILAELGA